MKITARFFWSAIALWIAVQAVLYHVYGGESPQMWIGGWAALPLSFLAVWGLQRLLRAGKHRSGSQKVLVVLVAMLLGVTVGLAATPQPAQAATYPVGCSWFFHAWYVNAGTVGSVNVIHNRLRVCQNKYGQLTSYTTTNSVIETTSVGALQGYGGDHSVIYGAYRYHNTSTLMDFSNVGYTRACVIRVTVLCSGTADFRTNTRVIAASVNGNSSYRHPWVEWTAVCTNSWCSYGGIWGLAFFNAALSFEWNWRNNVDLRL